MPTVSDKDPAVFDALAKRLQGKLFADKGYISQKLFDSLFEEGIQLVTGESEHEEQTNAVLWQDDAAQKIHHWND